MWVERDYSELREKSPEFPDSGGRPWGLNFGWLRSKFWIVLCPSTHVLMIRRFAGRSVRRSVADLRAPEQLMRKGDFQDEVHVDPSQPEKRHLPGPGPV